MTGKYDFLSEVNPDELLAAARTIVIATLNEASASSGESQLTHVHTARMQEATVALHAAQALTAIAAASR